MRVRITKPVDVRLEGAIKSLTAGETLGLPDDKAQKLITAGYAESAEATIDEIRAAVADFGRRNPGGGCLPWVQQNHPHLWDDHRRAMRGRDLTEARRTFDLMIETWNSRGGSQPALGVA